QLKAQQAAAMAQQEKNEGNSPCTGIITDLQTANNSTVQKDQVILHIKAVDSCSITLNVSAAQAKELKAGMPVSIKAVETPAPFSGKISSIDGTKITVTSDQKPEDLKDGVKVEISLAA
ncbi:MAG: HlyD family efflux transporter periplasmic adaptor subunit, partial [Phascolarctobacterium succinatutens]|nr:HlyD family efflux transporter periplasmic adaptor subunit [Phascolarctobacterium succinatutens]